MKLEAEEAMSDRVPTPAQTKNTVARPLKVLSTLKTPTAVVWLVMLLCFPLSRFFSDNFPSMGLARSVLLLGLFLAVIAFGQGIVILTGGVDLSIPATVALAAYVTGFLANDRLPTLVAILLALALAACVGVVNGLVVARINLPPFIVTLAVGTIMASLLLGVGRGAPAQPSPDSLARVFGGSQEILGVPTPVWVLILVILVGVFIQSGTVFGRHVYAVGNSPKASEITGIPLARTLVLAYGVAAVSYGLGGVMLLGYGSGADLNIGNPWLLPSIAAVVVGGSSIKGGSGSYLGTVGAVLLLTLIEIDIRAASIPEGFRQALYGLIIILALIGGRISTRAR